MASALYDNVKNVLVSGTGRHEEVMQKGWNAGFPPSSLSDENVWTVDCLTFRVCATR